MESFSGKEVPQLVYEGAGSESTDDEGTESLAPSPAPKQSPTAALRMLSQLASPHLRALREEQAEQESSGSPDNEEEEEVGA